MEYTHRENGHRIIFADEKDFLRARLVYLETYENPTISFLAFMQQQRYQGRPPMRRGRIEARVERDEREVVTVPIFSPSSEPNRNGDSYAQARINREEMRRRVEVIRREEAYRRQQEMHISRPYHRHGYGYEYDVQSLANERRQLEQLMALQQGYVNFNPFEPAVPANPASDDGNEFEVEFQAEFLGASNTTSSGSALAGGATLLTQPIEPPPRNLIEEMARLQPVADELRAMGYEMTSSPNRNTEVEEEPEIEEIVEKKSIKKTTVFDIIDID